MKLSFQNTFVGYFKFYYSIIGKKILLYLLLSVFISFLDGMGLAMFMPLLEAVNANKQPAESLGALTFLTDMISYMGFSLTITSVLSILVCLFIFKGIFKFIQLNFQINLRHSFIRKIRFGLVEDLEKLTYSGFLRFDSGKIQNTLTGEVQRLFQTMNQYFASAQAVVMLLTYIFLAVLANYQFAFLVALGAGLSNFLYRKMYLATKKASMEISTKGNTFNSYLVQAIHHFKYLKATNYFSRYASKLKQNILESEYLNRKIGFYNSISSSLKEPMIVVIVAAVIEVQTTWLGTSLSSILLSLLLFYRALSFLAVVQNSWQAFIQNIGGMYSVASITDEMEDMREISGNIIFDGLNNGMKLHKLQFSYGHKNVLQDINIEIPKNSTTALVGESGSGKTTLANIIAGLYNVKQGSFRIDDSDINSLNIESYRSKIGYISQEPVIFNDTIFNNVTFWAERTEKNINRFYKVIEMTSLTNFVNDQANKENTPLGDNGALISGGQKQRISIARELFKDAEILIFDEATSALDSETEKIIQDNINDLHGRYTIIIIAHRLSTIRKADAIHLLKKGSVDCSGTFDDLMRDSEQFRRMVSLQEFQSGDLGNKLDSYEKT